MEKLECPEKYSISTPPSWSDNESVDSIAWMSTTDLSRILPTVPDSSPSDQKETNNDLRDVIERQDLVIERLVKWCQNLEEEAVTHRKMLVAHERSNDDSEALCQKLVKELVTLKAATQNKSKAQVLQTKNLYDQMQARVDSCVTEWCKKKLGSSTTPKKGIPAAQVGKTSTQPKATLPRASSNSPPRRQPGNLSERVRSTNHEKRNNSNVQQQLCSSTKGAQTFASASFPLGGRSSGQRSERHASPNKPYPSVRYSTPQASRPSNSNSNRISPKSPSSQSRGFVKDLSPGNIDKHKSRESPSRRPYRERSNSPISSTTRAAPNPSTKKTIDGIPRNARSNGSQRCSANIDHGKSLSRNSVDKSIDGGTGRAFKFVARSVSPPNSMRHASPINNKVPTSPQAMANDGRNLSRGPSRGSPRCNNESPRNSMRQASPVNNEVPSTPQSIANDGRNLSRGPSRGSPRCNNDAFAKQHVSRSNSPTNSPRASTSALRRNSDLVQTQAATLLASGPIVPSIQSMNLQGVNPAYFGLSLNPGVDYTHGKFVPTMQERIVVKRNS